MLSSAVPAGIPVPAGPVGPVGTAGTLSPSDPKSIMIQGHRRHDGQVAACPATVSLLDHTPAE